MIRRVVAVFALIWLLSACGGDVPPSANPTSVPASVDDTFIARIGPHQDTALALARDAVERTEGEDVKRLARAAVRTREHLLEDVRARLARLDRERTPADLGVSAAQAGTEIRADALTDARPVDATFLTLMQRHDEGALALARAELKRGHDPGVQALARRLSVDWSNELSDIRQALVKLSRAGD